MKLTPVVVKWQDAESCDDWKGVEEVSDDYKLADIYTLGFLIKETKNHIIVGLSCDIDNDRVSSTITIPKKWCCEIRKLRVKV